MFRALISPMRFIKKDGELMGEGHRFFDLVRTGRAAQAINGFVVGKHEVFPIPQINRASGGPLGAKPWLLIRNT